MPWTFRATLVRIKDEAERAVLSPKGPLVQPQLTRGASGSSGNGRHIGADTHPGNLSPLPEFFHGVWRTCLDRVLA